MSLHHHVLLNDIMNHDSNSLELWSLGYLLHTSFGGGRFPIFVLMKTLKYYKIISSGGIPMVFVYDNIKPLTLNSSIHLRLDMSFFKD